MVTNVSNVATQQSTVGTDTSEIWTRTFKKGDKYLTYKERVAELEKLGKPTKVVINKGGRKVIEYRDKKGDCVGCLDIPKYPNQKANKYVVIGNLRYTVKAGSDKVTNIFNYKTGLDATDRNDNGEIDASEIFNFGPPIL